MSIFNLGNPGSTVCRYDFCSIPVFKQKSNWATKVWLQVESEGLLDWISVCNYFFWGVAWSLQVKVIRWTVCSWMVLRTFSFQILAFFSLNVYVACVLFFFSSFFFSLSVEGLHAIVVSDRDGVPVIKGNFSFSLCSAAEILIEQQGVEKYRKILMVIPNNWISQVVELNWTFI